MSHKSPFLVVKDLISPLQCEDIIKRLNHTLPNTDQQGDPTVTLKGNTLSEIRVLSHFNEILPELETYYGFETKTLTPFIFEWYPTGFSGQKFAQCEGSKFLGKRGQRGSWAKIKDYDFTVMIFLNDFNNETDFDERYEVRGGKVSFPTHDFSFNPQRGTSIIFPCRPQFINAISNVTVGDSHIIRFHIIAKSEYQYEQSNFPGGYKEWFGNV